MRSVDNKKGICVVRLRTKPRKHDTKRVGPFKRVSIDESIEEMVEVQKPDQSGRVTPDESGNINVTFHRGCKKRSWERVYSLEVSGNGHEGKEKEVS